MTRPLAIAARQFSRPVARSLLSLLSRELPFAVLREFVDCAAHPDARR
jgi:hypothetical protein